jgi:hypothetical protein
MGHTLQKLADTDVCLEEALTSGAEAYHTYRNSQHISYLKVKHCMEQTAVCEKMLHLQHA